MRNTILYLRTQNHIYIKGECVVINETNEGQINSNMILSCVNYTEPKLVLLTQFLVGAIAVSTVECDPRIYVYIFWGTHIACVLIMHARVRVLVSLFDDTLVVVFMWMHHWLQIHNNSRCHFVSISYVIRV